MTEQSTTSNTTPVEPDPFGTAPVGAPEAGASFAADAEPDELFDTQLRAVAHDMREQMQPPGELIEQTLAAARRAEGAQSAAQPVAATMTVAPQGAPVSPAPVPRTHTPRTKKRRRGRVIGFIGTAAAAAAAVLVIVGSVAVYQSTSSPVLTSGVIAADGIITPGSYDDIYASLQAQAFGSVGEGVVSTDVAPLLNAEGGGSDSAEAPSADSARAEVFESGTPQLRAEATATGADETSGSYSQTNTQVEGVDEADIVKTDGKHIYSLSTRYNEILITRADGRDTEELARISMGSSSVEDLYVNEGRLVVLFHGNTDDESASSSGYFVETSLAAVAIYEVSDPSNPELLNVLAQDGYLNTSRLVDGILYVASVHWIYSNSCEPGDPASFVPNLYTSVDMAELHDDSATAEPFAVEDIRILPDFERAAYTVLTAIAVDSAERESEISVLGSTDTVYMNADNLFLAAAIYDYGSALTHITRVALNQGSLDVAASTSFEGTLLNQFSLDEYRGYLRVAATVIEDRYEPSGRGDDGERFWSGSTTSNSLLIFDSSLRLTGSIEDLAPGERIYSARFTGDVGYMVTFRETDPLFSLDLSDPQNPRVMDALKIPGFSQYLHPYADGLLLGLGQDASSSGAMTGYLKLAVFDVSDPFAVREADKQLVDASYSEALNNHKAVLIDAEKNLIGFSVETEMRYDSSDVLYRYESLSYYLIYGYDRDTGFFERAAIELPEEYEPARALYLDDYLYLVNGDNIGVFSLDTLEEITWVRL
ncbi:MAG: beta-propeller domain-containing protein [Coriobacteriales bacterium]|jgi:uncharacterized secreted protein with C-terminal beta-propeller domain|nr:beta-propeller domain-containing protein [Coriobacteriales bacterium]